MIGTIPNRDSSTPILVSLHTDMQNLCPHSSEPQGGYIKVIYKPKDKLIELHSVEKFLKELSEGTDALDMETLVQLLYKACLEIGINVKVKANFILRNGLAVYVETTNDI